jgi:hypothetical protein
MNATVIKRSLIRAGVVTVLVMGYLLLTEESSPTVEATPSKVSFMSIESSSVDTLA